MVFTTYLLAKKAIDDLTSSRQGIEADLNTLAGEWQLLWSSKVSIYIFINNSKQYFIFLMSMHHLAILFLSNGWLYCEIFDVRINHMAVLDQTCATNHVLCIFVLLSL